MSVHNTTSKPVFNTPFCYDYPRPAVTVDLIVVAHKPGRNSHVLFVKRGKDPHKGKYALPGGFLNMDEKVADAAIREFKEECSAELPYDCEVEFFKVADTVGRDPRGWVISMVHVAIHEGDPFPVKGADDAVSAEWVPFEKVNQFSFGKELAFDHDKIICDFIEEYQWLFEDYMSDD